MVNDTDNDWHAHRLHVTKTLDELRTEVSELRKLVGGLTVKVAVISSSIAMSGTYALNWIVEHKR
jgi:hypothetical protein